MLDDLEWPSFEARNDQSSLLLFHNIHCDAVSIEKAKYLPPALSSKVTRSSHCAQYCRYQIYSDALKNSPPNYSTMELSFPFCDRCSDHRGAYGLPHLVKTQPNVVWVLFKFKISTPCKMVSFDRSQ